MTSGDDRVSSVALQTNTAAATVLDAPARRRRPAARGSTWATWHSPSCAFSNKATPLLPISRSTVSAMIYCKVRLILVSRATSRPPIERRKSLAPRIPRPAALTWTRRPLASIRNNAALRPSRTSAKAAASFGFPVDCLADEDRPTRVRCDKCHAPAHFIVDHVVRAASDDAEKLATLRSLEHGAGSIAPLLGPRPFLIGTPLATIIIGPEFLKARDLPTS